MTSPADSTVALLENASIYSLTLEKPEAIEVATTVPCDTWVFGESHHPGLEQKMKAAMTLPIEDFLRYMSSVSTKDIQKFDIKGEYDRVYREPPSRQRKQRLRASVVVWTTACHDVHTGHGVRSGFGWDECSNKLTQAVQHLLDDHYSPMNHPHLTPADRRALSRTAKRYTADTISRVQESMLQPSLRQRLGLKKRR